MHELSTFPSMAAWRLQGAHDGFEVARLTTHERGTTVTGTSVGVESKQPWSFRYVIEIDKEWRTRSARIESTGGGSLVIERERDGRWLVAGAHDPTMDGCLDIDLEGSAMTNTVPIHRLALAPRARADAPAVYVRTNTLRVERLDQTYERLPDEGDVLVFDYASPRFDYHAHLRFSLDGLVLDYPEIARRHPL